VSKKGVTGNPMGMNMPWFTSMFEGEFELISLYINSYDNEKL
jgi:hypothetical protein